MDADFLKKAVGPVLTKALSSMCIEQPKDAVEYLGAFLLNYVELEEGKAAQAELFTKAAAVAKEQEDAMALAAAEAAAAAKEAAKPPPGQEELLEQLGKTTDVAALFPALMDLVKAGTGAAGCYIGKKDATAATEEEPSVETITFVAGSEGSGVEGATLRGLPVGADQGEESEAQPEGVSFGLFVGTDPPEPEEPTDEEREAAAEAGEEPVEGEEGDTPPPGKIYPTEVVVRNVVRDPRVKFFGIPKIGAYACVPIKYKSCLHADGIGDAPEGEDGEGGEGGKAPNLVECEMLVGLHTMGQAGRQFSEKELDYAKFVAAAVAAALERSEKEVWDVEVVKVEAEVSQAATVDETINEAKNKAEEAAKEKEEALPEDLPEYERDLAIKQAAYEGARSVLTAVGAELGGLGDKRLPLKPEPVRLLQALLYTLGFTKEAFVDAATRKVDWEKMRGCFAGEAADLLVTLAAYKPEAEANVYPKYARVEEMRAMVEVPEAPSEALYGVVIEFVTAATDLRESAAAARKEREAAAKEAADAEEGE